MTVRCRLVFFTLERSLINDFFCNSINASEYIGTFIRVHICEVAHEYSSNKLTNCMRKQKKSNSCQIAICLVA